MDERDAHLRSGGRAVLAILAASAAFKLAFILAAGELVYGDVRIALQFGRAALEAGFAGGESGPLVINSKTLLGPILWISIHGLTGVAGLKAINLACFLALFALQWRLGRDAYPAGILATGLFLFAFYPGTNLNVIAGEPDDMVFAVLVAAGVLVHVRSDRPFAASFLLGLAFLFKFTAAVFWVGFAAFLLGRRRGKALLLSAAGMALPFAVLNLATAGHGLDCLRRSLEIQAHYSSSGEVAFKLFSTGLLPAVLVSAWAVRRGATARDTLFFCLGAVYLPYVLLLRDAYAAGYVMMVCMVFLSFLIARFLDEVLAGRGHPASPRRRALAAVLVAYFLATTAITTHNLYHDTAPLGIEAAAARERLLPIGTPERGR
ncbi:MAG: DUF2029 domain-containing protein [Planctomycetes bacterium]|nr:DUF2029 domain-containing protein [Planctomycetota bacterium]